MNVATNPITYYSDLHCHLGGATPTSILKELAYENNLEYNKMSYSEFSSIILNKVDCNNEFLGYLKRYDMIQDITSNPTAIEYSVYHAISEAYLKHNIDLIELKFNPMLRNKGGYYDLDVIIMSAINGLQKAKSIYPEVKAGLVIESDRSFSDDLTDILIKKSIKYKELGIIGFDISGYNESFRLSQYHVDIFRKLKDNGLGITLHSNESRLELDLLSSGVLKYVDRIGHGIQLMLHGGLNDCYEQNSNLLFEICPQSNLNSGVLNQQSLYVLANYICRNKNYYNFGLCTDGFLFNGGIEHQLRLLVSNCSYSYEQIEIMKEILIRVPRQCTFIK